MTIQKDVAGRPFAVFSKHKNTQIKTLFGLLVTLALIAFAYFYLDSSKIVGLQYVALISVMAVARISYNLYLDMPYLHFTEDRFFFDEDESNEGGAWRDVVDIHQVEIDSNNWRSRQKAVCLVKSDKTKFLIDPRIINFKSADVSGIAKQFWQSALSKLDHG